ncbi:KN motif and ankyrin repeat domain-containing protein 1-like isoform X2 [Hyla sarda]|nr:KN motif and ankyrin repeat domain-containing protein 1-like isoform X2 [Hyla sarda]XP_056413426.1 KN motif and ankyrin repeat domain-containing protein 1-like isoform X2 [Hyla sarda]XP_056413427.1 KN motif and ankyrin repeat domain-containing protein 1-like isoform X2 [Hyla sarda]XP_056413428.1 KN motif and ankyrin repeat domain-containing protein 1-like isoform X2 [Hyla sarda]
MTDSVNLRNDLPDLGGPFLYWDKNEHEKTSYSVETPYGFQLDLDFMKYVDDIQSGQTLRKLQANRKPRMPRRSTSSLRSLSSQTGAWLSTESLDFSEDGTSDSVFFTGGKTETNSSHTKETLTSRKSNPLSPTPYFKLFPPPPAKTVLKNSRVEKTLEETSRRLQQEQLNLYSVDIYDGSYQDSNLSKLSNASRSSPNLSHTSLAVYQNKSAETQAILNQSFMGSVKISPMNSGRSTPAANILPSHLQYIREQMAASLKRLKDLEEQVKIIPALQMKISTLERENKQLTYDLEKQNSMDTNGQTNSAHFTSNEIDGNRKEDVQSEQKSNLEPTGHTTSQIAKLKRLTEKLSDSDRNVGNKKMTGGNSFGHQPAVKEKTRKSIAVGEDVCMTDSVFYYRSRQKNNNIAVQASPETKDVGEWVMESLLGLSSDVEKEIQLLQHTVDHQRAVISMLEDHVKAAADELEELRIAIACRQDKDKIVQENPLVSFPGVFVPNGKELPEHGLQMSDTEIICSCTTSSEISDVTDKNTPKDITNSMVKNTATSTEVQSASEPIGDVCHPSTKQKAPQMSEDLVSVIESEDIPRCTVWYNTNADKGLVNTEGDPDTSVAKDK